MALDLGEGANALDVAILVELEELPGLRAVDVQPTGLRIEGQAAQLHPVRRQRDLGDLTVLRGTLVVVVGADANVHDASAIEDVEPPADGIDGDAARRDEAEGGEVEPLDDAGRVQSLELVGGGVEREHAAGVEREEDGVLEPEGGHHVAALVGGVEQLELRREGARLQDQQRSRAGGKREPLVVGDPEGLPRLDHVQEAKRRRVAGALGTEQRQQREQQQQQTHPRPAGARA